MSAAKKKSATKRARPTRTLGGRSRPVPPKGAAPSGPAGVRAVLASLEGMSARKDRENLARFGITAGKAYGVSMANIQTLAKRLGRDHALAGALWKSGWYEARMLAAFVDEPEKVTATQMERWCRDFDNWGICDTVCFQLFDRTPHAWDKVDRWCDRDEEFVKRAGFALLACLALHDKRADDKAFVRALHALERGARDERNFVKKGVSWALRLIGRRNPALNVAALQVARRLADSPDAAARWVGRGAFKELTARS